MKNAFLLFTKIMFNNFFAGACAQIKICDKPSYHFRCLGFHLFIFSLYIFLSSFVFAAVFRLLPGFFPRKRKRGKSYLPLTSKGWKGKFCSEFSAKILDRFGVYFKLHKSNHAGLDIVAKVLFCFTPFWVKSDDVTSGTNARILY